MINNLICDIDDVDAEEYNFVIENDTNDIFNNIFKNLGIDIELDNTFNISSVKKEINIKEEIINIFKEDITKLPLYDKIDIIKDSILNNKITVINTSTSSGKSVLVPLITYLIDYTVYITIPLTTAVNNLYNYINKNLVPNDIIAKGSNNKIDYNIYQHKLIYTSSGHALNFLIKVVSGIINITTNFILIIDEAHTKSVENTTLIHLAMYAIKNKIIDKLIIMTATPNIINFDDISVNIISSDLRRFNNIIINNDENIINLRNNKLNFDVITKTKSFIDININKYSLKKIVVFLPGLDIINKLALELSKNTNYILLIMYSQLSDEEKNNINIPIQSFYDKILIILSTDVLENSITIQDLDAVFDMGLSKYINISSSNIKTLELEYISKSRCKQREGRVGRTKMNGIYFYLNTEEFYNNLIETEISDLERIFPYNIFLLFYKYNLNPNEIIQMNEDKKVDIINKLKIYKLIDKTNKITDIGENIMIYPVSFQNSIILYEAIKKLNKASIIGIIIIISMFEACNGTTFWHIPRDKYNDSNFIKINYEKFKGENDLITYLNIFIGMIKEYNFNEWAINNKLNFNLLKIAKNNFIKLIKIVYPSEFELNTTIINFFNILGMDIYNIKSDKLINSTVYNLIAKVYYNNIYVRENNKSELYISKKSTNKHSINKFNSYSNISTKLPNIIISMQVNIYNNKYLLSCVFEFNYI
jgi:HrpA-like RNA helicase